MCKKGLSVLVLLSLWMCLTGFASLGEEGKDTWNSMMEQLSAEEIDQLLAEENEWVRQSNGERRRFCYYPCGSKQRLCGSW